MATQINDKERVIKIFSQLANINFNYPAQKVHYLVDNFNRVKDIIAKDDNVAGKKIKELWDCNWNVVWGPVLNTSPSIGIKYHADNSMYVVKGIDKETKKNIYIVAIAGTNSLSTFEMKDEDIAVKEVELWDKGNEDYGSLAKGSMTGLGILLSDFKKKLSPNEVLMKFFEAEYAKDHNMEIITCGHSLGGALSPLVALRLKEWSGTKIPVSTYPTAGPTSGDRK
jgi:Lipase (class 3)